MTLEQQVTSLELSKRLKELGVKQESYFYWREKYHTEERLQDDGSHTKYGVFDGGFSLCAYPHPRYSTADFKWNERDLSRLNETEISAFTVAELGEIMSRHFVFSWASGEQGEDHEWSCKREGITIIPMQTANTEADARAKMLVYLIENNLLTV